MIYLNTVISTVEINLWSAAAVYADHKLLR